MKLGFVSTILSELSLEEVLDFAASSGFNWVELMCWPKGRPERRYSGVTHIDVTDLTEDSAVQIKELIASKGVGITGLGYYPNLLVPDQVEGSVYVEHLRKVIRAAAQLGVDLVNTFVGRDWTLSVDDNWPRFLEVWRPLVALAEDHGVRIGIENCPMLFTGDEWPGGKNLAYCPAIWRRIFEDIPSDNLGLNYDPSHMVWQFMDYIKPLREFSDRIFHIHAKDARVDRDRLDEVGILATPLEYHTPKLPGLGEIDWGRFMSVLQDTGFDGPICVEAEDRAYEKSLETRKLALVQIAKYLRQFIGEDF